MIAIIIINLVRYKFELMYLYIGIQTQLVMHVFIGTVYRILHVKNIYIYINIEIKF